MFFFTLRFSFALFFFDMCAAHANGVGEKLLPQTKQPFSLSPPSL